MDTVYEFRYVERDNCVGFREATAERLNIRWVSEDNGSADEPVFIFKHFVGRIPQTQEQQVPREYGHSNVYQVFLNKVVRSHQGCGIRTASVDRKNKLGDMYFCYALTDEGCVIHSCAGNASNMLALESVCRIYKKKIPSKDLEDELKEMKCTLEKMDREIQKQKENNEELLKKQEEKDMINQKTEKELIALAGQLEKIKRSNVEMSKELEKAKTETKTEEQQLRATTDKLKQSQSECAGLQLKYAKVLKDKEDAQLQLRDVKRELEQVQSDYQSLRQKYDNKNDSKYADTLRLTDRRVRENVVQSHPISHPLRSRASGIEQRRMLHSVGRTLSTTSGSSVPGRTYERREYPQSSVASYGISNIWK